MPIGSKYHSTDEQIVNEEACIKAARKDPAKFEALYKKYHEQIFRFIYQRLDDKELAFDTASEVFLKAMLNLYRYEFRGVPFASWLYRIAYSEVNQLFRDNKAQRTINIESYQVYDIIDEIKEDKLEKYHDKLIEAISQLPEQELQLVEMRYFEKRPFSEIGEMLDITENNAKVKLYRILDKLKKTITSKQ
ncbi:MAG: sigma-70 family RNA polymerase sigma factor [Bacteroidota bacterium]